MSREITNLLSGEVLEEDVELTLSDLCRTCQLPAERILRLVEEGVIEPLGRDPARWRFSGICIRRVQCMVRLQSDLGVNTAGAALALDLIDEIERLHRRLRRLESDYS